MPKSLKERTISGMIWSSVHKFGTMGISFVANLVLARLLTPEDFGIIGMIAVFIVISGTLVDGGFASALIQKKNPTKEDYSTIFYWNLFISVVLFITLYLTAPAIERFYNIPDLSIIMRVQGLVLIMNAFNIIQFNQLRKQLNFKLLASTNLRAAILGTTVCIVMAFIGFGVWSLVTQLLLTTFLQTIFLWYASSWRPALVFSRKSFRELFGFGSFMLLTSILDKTYNNVQALIIGRVFSAGDLGFFSQAKKLEDIPVRGLSTIVNQVTFPVFSQMKDDLERMRKGISKSLKAITFLNFPLMVLLIVIAKPLILFLFTDKWDESIPYFQILCAGGMIWTVNTTNTNIFKSLGRSDIYFYVQLTKRIIGVLMILYGLRYGIEGMLYATALSAYVFFFVNTYFSSRLSGYSTLHQIKDIFPSFILSIAVGILVYLSSMVMRDFALVIMIFIQSVLYTIMYIGISYVLKLEAFIIYYEVIEKKLKGKWKK